MDIEVRLKDNDSLMVIGNLDHSDEPITYDLYGYDEQENQLLFKLTRWQIEDLLDSLIRRSELEDFARKLIKKYGLINKVKK